MRPRFLAALPVAIAVLGGVALGPDLVSAIGPGPDGAVGVVPMGLVLAIVAVQLAWGSFVVGRL